MSACWGILFDDGSMKAGLQGPTDALRAHLEGLVLAPPIGNGSSGHAAPSSLTRLVEALRSVPDHVETLVCLDMDTFREADRDLLPDMVSLMDDGVGAVVRGTPVTDALKEVDGRRVLDSVERNGLFTVHMPHVLRRSALDDALLALPGSSWSDPISLLLATSQPVRLLPLHPASSTRHRRPVITVTS